VVDVELDKLPVVFSQRTAVTVVMASGGYPGSYATNKIITGLTDAERLDAVAVFHAGTTHNNTGDIVTSGGRVLTVTATGESFPEARARAYAGVERIHFENAYYRKDIGWRAL
jgi:phosphoribosylamine---glycine ligase